MDTDRGIKIPMVTFANRKKYSLSYCAKSAKSAKKQGFIFFLANLA